MSSSALSTRRAGSFKMGTATLHTLPRRWLAQGIVVTSALEQRRASLGFGTGFWVFRGRYVAC
jgi:hypothetical protein